MQFMKNAVAGWAVLTCFTLAVGCGGGAPPRPKLGKVTGTVTYNGKPLPQGQIIFMPEKGNAATGDIKDGAILNLTTFDVNDGVVLGVSKVTIKSVEKNKDPMAPAKSLIPANYGVIGKSDLTAEIKPAPNTVKFELKD